MATLTADSKTDSIHLGVYSVNLEEFKGSGDNFYTLLYNKYMAMVKSLFNRTNLPNYLSELNNYFLC